MKRSEMVYRIRTRLFQLVENVEERPDIECEIKDQFAEIILCDLEKLGMLPPERLHFYDEDAKVLGEGFKRDRTWEPENEKK